MAHVLITGGAGFIGSHLCDALLAAGHQITVLDDFSSGRKENLEGRAIRLIEDHVGNIARYADELTDVTLIYHLAALISGYDSLQEPHEYVEANISDLMRVLDFAKGLKRPHIVFASSSTVYGTQESPVMRESTLPNPITMYSMSKLAGEQMLKMYAELYGYTFNIARLFNVYGPRQNPDHPYANVTCKFSHAAALGRGVKLYGDGVQSRDFVFVSDVIAALVLLATPGTSQVYNVGTSKQASIKELLETVQRLADNPLPVEKCPPWPNDIRAIEADTSRIRDEFGYEAKVSFEEGLGKTIAFFKARGF